MKIVLVRPNYKSFFITPPIGLGYLASYLKQYGIEVKIIDGLLKGIDEDATVKQIAAENADAVGITCLSTYFNEAIKLSHKIKSFDETMKVIIGGMHATFMPRETLEQTKADFVIRGEGEIALLKLIQNAFVNDGLDGVYSQQDLKDSKNFEQKSPIVKELDEIPFPLWEQIPPRDYPLAPHGAIVRKYPIGIITTTRGCPYECSFCSSPHFYDRRIRYRSPENVIEEINFLVKRFGVREIAFEDDNLTLDRSHMEKICQLILKHNLNITWTCPNGIRADKVDEELLKLMKKSGCYYVSLGIESADNDVLKRINKNETIETIEKAIKAANKVGLLTNGFFILGLPGETEKSLQKTVQFIKKSKLFRVTVVILAIMPGSRLWNELRDEFTFDHTKVTFFAEPDWLPEGITKEQLMRAHKQALHGFYFNPKKVLKIISNLKFGQIKYLLQAWKYYNTPKR